MQTRKLLISEATVKRLPFAKDPRGYVAIDTRLPGFRVKVGINTKTFRLQLDVPAPDSGNKRKRQTLSFPLGKCPSTTADEARRKAKAILDRRDRDEPLTGPTGAVTLMQAWESYEKLLLKKRSSWNTIEDYRARVERHLKQFHHKPMRDITRAAVVSLHSKITEAGAPYMANGTLRVGHAIWNHASKDLEVPGLGLNPFRLRNLANPEEPRQTGMDETGLAKWFGQVKALSNPIMREYQMMVAMTGRRREAVASMRWDRIHVRDRYVEFPASKRGRGDRIPLSKPMMRSLARARVAGRVMCNEERCRPWVFPSIRSASGHMTEPKGSSHRQMADGTLQKVTRIEASPHALRHTWITLAPRHMHLVHSKLLVGHKLSNDIHQSYMTIDSMFTQLREPQARFQAHLLAHMGKDPERALKRLLHADITGPVKRVRIGASAGETQSAPQLDRDKV
jgi:integrase